MKPYHKTRNIYAFCMDGTKAVRKREARKKKLEGVVKT